VLAADQVELGSVVEDGDKTETKDEDWLGFDLEFEKDKLDLDLKKRDEK